jgi:gliding motility-associated-like protein
MITLSKVGMGQTLNLGGGAQLAPNVNCERIFFTATYAPASYYDVFYSSTGNIGTYSSLGIVSISSSTPFFTGSGYYYVDFLDISFNFLVSTDATPLNVLVNKVTKGSISGAQTICIGGDPTIFGSVAGTGDGNLSYRWESNTNFTTPNWNTISGVSSETYDVISGLSLKTQYRRYAISTLSGLSCETSTPTNSLTIDIDQLPTSSIAGSNDIICASSTKALTANSPITGTGIWSITGTNSNNSQLSSTSSPTAIFTPISSGSYTLTWTISNGVCPTSNSSLSINVDALPTVSNAGSGSLLCSNATKTLSANNPIIGTGLWSISGANSNVSQLSTTSIPNAIFTPQSVGNYTLTWTISNGVCVSSASSINIDVNQSPTLTSVTQANAACSGTNTQVTLSGLLSGKHFNILFSIDGINQTQVDLPLSSTSNDISTRLLDYNNDNGKTLLVYKIEEIGGANCFTNFNAANSVNLIIDPLSNAGSIVGGTDVCTGNNSTTLTINGNVGNILNWESSNSNSFSTLTNIANITSSYTATNLSSTKYYRAQVKSGVCPSVYTITPALINVVSLPNDPIVQNINTSYDALSHSASVNTISGEKRNWYQDLTSTTTISIPSRTNVGLTSAYVEAELLNSPSCKSANRILANINITPAPLTIIGITGVPKVYDGNTNANANVSGTPNYSGLVGGESFNVIGTPNFTFNDKNVGTAKPITVSGYTPPSTNYTLTQPTGLTADITAASLTINGIAGQNKIYDGNNTAFINGTAVYSGLVSGDNFTVAGTPTFLFADKNVGTAKSITVSGYITPSSNYILSAQPAGLLADITPKSLVITGLVANNKPYDGNTVATVNGTPAYDGLVAADAGFTTVQGGPSFNFDTKDAGTAKPITVTGYTAPSTNYTLTQPTGLTANITPAPLTITGISGANKVYDRNTTAAVTGTPIYIGLIAGENLNVVGTSTYSFSDKNVGTAKPITVSGFTAPNGNYTLSAQPTGISADITPKLLTVTGSIPDRVYDATTNTSGIVLDNDRITGDIVNVSRTSAAFENPNAGVNKNILLSGVSIIPADDGGNYFLASPNITIQGTIKPLPINIVATDATKTELDPDPPFKYQPVSLLGTDLFTGALSRFPGEAPGDYPMTLGSLSAGSNYTLIFTTANFKIKPLVTNYIFDVPNAFTPNQDTYNDELKIIKNYRVTGLNYFRIYNRTGQLVFETKNLEQGWNGRMMGDMTGNVLESDLYIWVAEFTNMNDLGPVKKTGSVLLLK